MNLQAAPRATRELSTGKGRSDRRGWGTSTGRCIINFAARHRGVARRVEVAQRGRRVEEAGEDRSGGALESEAGREAAGHDGGAAGGAAHLDRFSVLGRGQN